MLLKIKGEIEFSPEDITKKHKSQSDWKRVALIKTDCDLDRYYAWFLKKRFNLELNRNLRGPHVTFISDKMDKNIFEEGKKLFHGKDIDFYIDLEPRTDGLHWWLRVYAPDAEKIREVMGLTKTPYFDFHLTIGHANEKNLEHSKYILRISKMFEIISNQPRQDFNQHTIYE